MGIRTRFVGVIAFLVVASGLVAQDEKLLHVAVGTKTALVSCPPKYNPLRRYPFMMVVGGVRQTAMDSYLVWQPIAADMGYILVCPSGNLDERGKITDEDRQSLVTLRNYLDRNFRVDASTSLLIGFAGGANLAVETAVVYPRKFRNMVGFYGFFNTKLESMLRANTKGREYLYSEFILVTSDGDPSQNSLTRLNDLLQDLGLQSELIVYPDMLQGYPPDLRSVMSRVRVKVAENAKKEMNH
jgi:predicted esterase